MCSFHKCNSSHAQRLPVTRHDGDDDGGRQTNSLNMWTEKQQALQLNQPHPLMIVLQNWNKQMCNYKAQWN